MVRKGDNVRSYVTQELDPSLDERVFSMLEKLWAFQIRAFKKDPVKARHYGKRLVMGTWLTCILCVLVCLCACVLVRVRVVRPEPTKGRLFHLHLSVVPLSLGVYIVCVIG